MQQFRRLSIFMAGLAALSAVFFAASASAFPIYKYSTQFGSRGTSNGQFQEPEGAAIDSAGNFWVADRGNVQKFNSKGEFLLKITKGIYTMDTPKDVAVTSAGNIWVTDAGEQRVVEFSTNGTYIREFGGKYGSGNGEFEFPNSIAIDSGGNLWVVDHDHVQEFNSEGTFIRKFGSEGTGNGQFSYITGLAIDAENNVWVADSNGTTGTTRLQEFNSSGTYIKQIGAKVLGETTTDVLSIHGGNLWVSTGGNCYCIKVLNTNGTIQTQFGGPNASEGEMIWTSGVMFDPSGNPWVLDTATAMIEKWVPAPPVATAEATTEIKFSEATLHGQVNPEGSATTYQFEYGTTTSYGSKVPASPASAGSGLSNVFVKQSISGLTPKTTYHYRVVATSAAGTTYSSDQILKTPSEISSRLDGLPVINEFDLSSESKANFETMWGALGWATLEGEKPSKGVDTFGGWTPKAAVSGAYYNEKISNLNGRGTATVVNLVEVATAAERYFSLWLDMPTPAGVKAGYELRCTSTGEHKTGGFAFTVSLVKWQAGVQTVLASATNVTLGPGRYIALVDEGGAVSTLIKSGSEFTSLLSASDSSFSSGMSGIEANAGSTYLYEFKTGAL